MEPHPKFGLVIEGDIDIEVLGECYIIQLSRHMLETSKVFKKWFERTGNGDWLDVLRKLLDEA